MVMRDANRAGGEVGGVAADRAVDAEHRGGEDLLAAIAAVSSFVPPQPQPAATSRSQRRRLSGFQGA